MRILQVIQRFPPAIGGGEEVVYQLSKELVRRGHEVTVATSNWLLDDDIPGFSKLRVNIQTPRHPLPAREIENGIRIYRFKPFFRFWTYTATPSLVTFLQKNIGKFDVVNSHYYLFMESALSALFSRAKSTPLIITVHGSFSSLKPYSKFYRFGKGFYDATVGAFVLGLASKILVLAPQIKKEFLGLGIPEEKLVVIPNGIDFRRLTPHRAKAPRRSPKGSERMVLFVGRLEKQKGPQYLVEAIPEICSNFPKTKFVFVGEDWGYQTSLIGLCRKLGVLSRCNFTGRIEDQQRLAGLYATADVLVLPAIGEGFGLVALESLYCGTPVVLADADALSFILHEFGGYPLDMNGDIPCQIVEHVKKIFLDGPDEDSLSNARKRIEREYSWSAIVDKLERVYEEVAYG